MHPSASVQARAGAVVLYSIKQFYKIFRAFYFFHFVFTIELEKGKVANFALVM